MNGEWREKDDKKRIKRHLDGWMEGIIKAGRE